jgi:TM2 domain-containing membrane protein YozV
MKQNTKDFLFVGAGILIALVFIIAVIVAASYVFNIANIVNGNG